MGKIKIIPIFVFSVLSLGTLIKSPCYEVGQELMKEGKKIGTSEDRFNDENSKVDIEKEKEETETEKKVIQIEERQAEKDDQELSAKVRGMVMDRISGTPVVVLETDEHKRFVPIWIGFAEAVAIDIVLRGINPPRPMTHDLIRSIIDSIGGKVKKVTITDIKSNTYYAEIWIELNGRVFRIDSRPSDALALALRTKSPIFITNKILSASIKIPDEEEDIWSKFGISVQQITSELEEFFGSKGLVVSDVKEGSIAYGKIRRGDIIIEVNSKSTKEQGINVLKEEMKGKREVELTIIRDKKKLKTKIAVDY